MTSKNFVLEKLSKIYLLFITLLLSCNSKAPVISSVDPKIGRMGEVITLSGKNFGSARDEAYITIAGIPPTNSSYYLWQDNLIVVRIPELGESGLVYVHSKGKKSNGVLFSNYDSVPRPAEGEEMGLEPKIASVSPQTGTPGTLVTITGSNFGVHGEEAGVFFSWDYDSTSFNPYIVREPEFIEVSEIEHGYDSWSAREIRVRLPDGAISGNIEVRTPNGKSRPFFFETGGKPGIKNFKDKRSYTVSYSVDIRVLEATRPNTLYLWIPKPIVSPSQRNISLVSRSAEPFVENHKGVSLFKLDNLVTGTSQSINLSFRADVYAVETELRPASVRQEASLLRTAYTQSSALLPSDDAKIKAAISSVTGREQNPYTKAKLLYDWIVTNIQINKTLPAAEIKIIDALEQKQSDPYSAALLYTTMLRAAGIPCIPVAGVLIDRNGQTHRHYWSEFWIDNFGWMPADPVLGAGGAPGSFTTLENYTSYYFGNMDSQRIAFSRGELILSQIESRGRLVSHTQSFSLQNIWEEAAGGLESYSSLWGDITISGIYIQ